MGNRLHLAFRRQVAPAEAEEYAEKNAMGFFEVSSNKIVRYMSIIHLPPIRRYRLLLTST